MDAYRELINIFLHANEELIKNDHALLKAQLSERCICARLMIYLNSLIESSCFNEYFVDAEYNRNESRIKTIRNERFEVLAITCDLIIHSRGTIIEQDNLLAIEMKKSSAPHNEKEKDRRRLCALTKSTFDDIWSFDGTCLPEHVCRYLLGIFYEINFIRQEIFIEYYRNGGKIETVQLSY